MNCVWRIDRLGRILKHITDFVLSLNEKGIFIKVLWMVLILQLLIV